MGPCSVDKRCCLCPCVTMRVQNSQWNAVEWWQNMSTADAIKEEKKREKSQQHNIKRETDVEGGWELEKCLEEGAIGCDSKGLAPWI